MKCKWCGWISNNNEKMNHHLLSYHGDTGQVELDNTPREQKHISEDEYISNTIISEEDARRLLHAKLSELSPVDLQYISLNGDRWRRQLRIIDEARKRSIDTHLFYDEEYDKLEKELNLAPEAMKEKQKEVKAYGNTLKRRSSIDSGISRLSR
jgi:hypothetical protein